MIDGHVTFGRLTQCSSEPGEHKYVALKIYTLDGGDGEEFNCTKLWTREIVRILVSHVRTAVDKFKLDTPGDNGVMHHCLVQKPMWDSWSDIVRWRPY